jgi:hypothetical protein
MWRYRLSHLYILNLVHAQDYAKLQNNFTSVSSASERYHARTGDIVDRDGVVFVPPEHADVCQAARAITAARSQTVS